MVAERPVWQILIATVMSRTSLFTELLESLIPQIEPHAGKVEVIAYRDNRQRTIGYKRDALVRAATADYVSHLDDDDIVVDDFVETLLPLMDGVDYVSYDIVADGNGWDNFVVHHKLNCEPRWGNNERWVDIGHLMPMRRELHALGKFSGGWGEDARWSDEIRASGRLKTEHHVDRIMYTYRVSDGELWRARQRFPAQTINPPFPHVRYLRGH